MSRRGQVWRGAGLGVLLAVEGELGVGGAGRRGGRRGAVGRGEGVRLQARGQAGERVTGQGGRVRGGGERKGRPVVVVVVVVLVRLARRQDGVGRGGRWRRGRSGVPIARRIAGDLSLL